jgi:hypothetical protein
MQPQQVLQCAGIRVVLLYGTPSIDWRWQSTDQQCSQCCLLFMEQCAHNMAVPLAAALVDLCLEYCG